MVNPNLNDLFYTSELGFLLYGIVAEYFILNDDEEVDFDNLIQELTNNDEYTLYENDLFYDAINNNISIYIIKMSDILYYNVVQNNNTSDKQILKYEETRSGVIIDNPSEWQVAVCRFNVPGILIPITLFDNDENLVVKLQYDNCDVAVKLVYLSRRSHDARTPTYTNAIYTIAEMLDIINYGYYQALEKLIVECPTFPPIDPETGEPYFVLPPIFEFDPVSQLISFFSDQNFYDYSLQAENLPCVKVIMNLALYSKFSTFDAFAIANSYVPETDTDDKFQQLMITPSFGDPVVSGFIKMTQEHVSLSLLNDAHTIVFESAALPLSTEFLPATSTERNVTRPILTDFLIPANTNDRSDIQFTASGLQLRWIDMKSDTPLRSIDITGYFSGKDSDLNPLFIPPYDNFTMKLAFRKKSQYIEKRGKHQINYSIHNKPNDVTEQEKLREKEG